MSDMRVFRSDEWLCDDVNILKTDINGEHIAHKHEFVEFVYICNGKGKQHIDDAVYDVKKGDVIFVNCNQVHAFEGEMEFYNILLKSEFMSESLIDTENAYAIFALSVFDEINKEIDKSCQNICFDDDKIPYIEKLVVTMCEEYEKKDIGYKAVLKGYMQIFFTEVMRMMYTSGHSDVIKYAKKTVPDIIKYIDENLNEKLSLAELAEKCFFNPSYFSRMFKRSHGVNFSSYVCKKRIEAATRLLTETDISITEIGIKVGYNDKAQFYKTFKKYMGVTPKTYREQNSPQKK